MFSISADSHVAAPGDCDAPLAEQTAHLPDDMRDDMRDDIVWRNCARLYGLDMAEHSSS